MKPGLYRDLSIRDYHGGPGISNSGLTDMAHSPANYHAWHLNPKRPVREKKSGQLEGTLAHCALLEPAEFDKRYIVTPADAPRTPSRLQWQAKNPSPESVKAMNWWREFNASTEGKEIITTEQRDVAFAQAESMTALTDVFDKLSMLEILAHGWAEESAYWEDEETGVLCRCRPDFVFPLNDREVILLDVKTCGDARSGEFGRHVARKRYHVQDAFYWNGYQHASGKVVRDFIYVPVESEWPYASTTYSLDDEARTEGYDEFRRILNLYAECLKNDRWPGLASGKLSLPGYAITPTEVEISYVL